MRFPIRRIFQCELALQVVSATSILAFAVPAAIALAASLLVHHRVAAALWAEVSCDGQVAQVAQAK